MFIHPVNLRLVNLEDGEPLELEAGAELTARHSEFPDQSEDSFNAIDQSDASIIPRHDAPLLHGGRPADGALVGSVDALVNSPGGTIILNTYA